MVGELYSGDYTSEIIFQSDYNITSCDSETMMFTI